MSKAEKKDHADTEPGAQAPGMTHEADIGSGEKTPGEQDTQAIVESVPKLPETQPKTQPENQAESQAETQPETQPGS